ncbi:M23 family metallopeptidase [Altererythrobacter sp. SALINAS58]|uniref:M23 family metallopeptidase n=1 Tax=Alteripontixanthobacter muriae TaxID=2705546 RepID=UPI001E2F1897|nr:M23 family metallopeptidase [Alteripontixanthobacter muriae]NTZ41502.1 M23 family metallopeptidase [Alteripontixanthobacter muriae]
MTMSPSAAMARPKEVSFTAITQEDPMPSSAQLSPLTPTSEGLPAPNASGAVITIGPEGVQSEAPIYAIRSTVAGSGLLVDFTSSPPSAQNRQGLITQEQIYPQGSPIAGVVTSRFGVRMHPLTGGRRAHQGIDIAASAGTPIRATANGFVSVAGWGGGYGLLVTIDHPAGLQTRYAHLSRLNVRPGQDVAQGDIIGFVGSTGNSTGPHLHYEVRRDGLAVDPAVD